MWNWLRCCAVVYLVWSNYKYEWTPNPLVVGLAIIVALRVISFIEEQVNRLRSKFPVGEREP
jgi:hypothetical protein